MTSNEENYEFLIEMGEKISYPSMRIGHCSLIRVNAELIFKALDKLPKGWQRGIFTDLSHSDPVNDDYETALKDAIIRATLRLKKQRELIKVNAV